MNKIFLSAHEAADILSIGRSTLLALAYSGSIPSIKVGRRRLFPTEGLFRWARSQTLAESDKEELEEFLEHVDTALRRNAFGEAGVK